MISFLPTEDESAFVKVAKEFATKKVRPLARKSEVNGKVDKDILREVKKLGFLSLEFTEDWEGLGLPLISQVQILQALSYGDLGVVQGFTGAGDAKSFIRLLSEDPILKPFKGDILKGKTVALLDITDGWGENVTLTEDVNGYRLQGTSKPVRLAEFADYVVVVSNGSTGDSLLLWLEKDQWKVEKGDYRLGLLASGIARLTFDGVTQADSQVVVKGNDTAELITQARTRMMILQAAKEVGLMEAALDYATEYTAGRKAFGKEIATFQGVSFRIAEMAMETRIANHLVREAALKADDGDKGANGYALRTLYRAHRFFLILRKTI